MQMAEETGCNLSAIRHLNKTGAGRATYRDSGSIGVGCSRCAYLKTNVGELPPSLGFRVIAGEGLQVEWLGAVDYAADDLLPVPGKETTAQDRAAAILSRSSWPMVRRVPDPARPRQERRPERANAIPRQEGGGCRSF
jgi:hypothetical protein